jgi:hypothetical protein
MRGILGIAADTWGACFTWARKIYTAVVCSAVSYAAPVTSRSQRLKKDWMVTEQAEKEPKKNARRISSHRPFARKRVTDPARPRNRKRHKKE